MRVALRDEGLRHLDAAGLRDAADVVAREVDQHEVLGALLRVAEQFLFHRRVQLRRGAARARAGDGADRDLLALGHVLVAHQDLGRGADDLERPHVVEVHVRRRVERAQRAVQAQRRLGVALAQALADLHLHHVARGDVLLGLQHRVEIGLLGELALHGVRRPAAHRRRGHRVAQLVGELVEAALRGEVGVGLRRVGVDDEVEPARQVVDHRELLGLQQQDVGRVEAAGLGRPGEPGLDVAHGVVAEVACEPAAEARQARAQGDLEAALVGLDEVERVALVRLDDAAVGHDLGRPPGGLHAGARGQADEGVAAEALAADDRFQQEALRLPAGELEVQRQRRLEVGEGLEDHRDAVEALAGQALEFEFGDHVGGLRDAGMARRILRRGAGASLGDVQDDGGRASRAVSGSGGGPVVPAPSRRAHPAGASWAVAGRKRLRRVRSSGTASPGPGSLVVRPHRAARGAGAGGARGFGHADQSNRSRRPHARRRPRSDVLRIRQDFEPEVEHGPALACQCFSLNCHGRVAPEVVVGTPRGITPEKPIASRGGSLAARRTCHRARPRHE